MIINITFQEQIFQKKKKKEEDEQNNENAANYNRKHKNNY